MRAGYERIRNVDVGRGNHYLVGQAELVSFVADEIAAWADSL